MKRRDFTAQLLAGSAAASITSFAAVGPAQAQGGPVEGTHYVRLSQPLPVPPGKIEVLEFFWYGCPHCNAFEPMLDAWQKKLPPDVAFRRVPVAFSAEPFTAHQRIFYALEALGQFDAVHRKVFAAIHVDHQRLDKLPDITAFMVKNGVDGPKFEAAFNSFSVQTKARQAKQLAEAYRIDGVPAIGINGRFYTSGTLAGANERALQVADFLIQQERSKKG